MDDSEILELVAEGEIEPEDIDDFREMNEEFQEMVRRGEISMEVARDLGLTNF
jgi:hypothetical protein